MNILLFSSSFIFDLINLILAGKEDMHESLYEFEFRQILQQSYCP